MLQYLRIKNLALMEETSLEFTSGFCAVTGETGAGKSILLGALNLLSGARVDKSIIRKGAEECEVAATLYFNDPTRINTVLKLYDLPLCEPGEPLLLRRMLSRTKANRIQVNGMLTTLTILQKVGENWIDFHGSGEPQKLFHESYQLEMLDLFSKNQVLLEDYQKEYGKWKEVLRKIHFITEEKQLSIEESNFLREQITKVDILAPTEASIEKLESDFNRLHRLQELIHLIQQLGIGLSGEEGVTTSLSLLLKVAREITDIDPSTQPFMERLNGIILEIEDLASEYENVLGTIDIEEEAIQAVQDQMQQWLEIKRSYGPSVTHILEKRTSWVNALEAQTDIQERRQALEQKAEELQKDLWQRAEILRETREKAAVILTEKVKTILKTLGFKKVDFQIKIIAEPELQKQGNCRCAFLFAPNAGQDFLPLSKIASSGEIARVMLALKATVAEVDQTPLLVFDEVDANIGGEIATEVGKKLASLGVNHQVLCVTHLPQVAAWASRHLHVKKEQTSDKTTVTLSVLHDRFEERKIELARMLGDRNSVSALQHAEELLAQLKI